MIGYKNLNNFGGIIIFNITNDIVEWYYDFGGDNVSELYKDDIKYNSKGEPYFETKEGKQYLKDYMKK